MGVNRVILVGHLGRDPEVRSTKDGKTVTNFSVATSEGAKGKETTTWHRVIAWDRLGDLCGQYLKKGRLVYVDGRISQREYQGKDGTQRTAFEIVANNIQFLGGNTNGNGSRPAYGDSTEESVDDRPPLSIGRDDEDIPF
jgi:single-strand DNA-binding protein